MNISVSHEQASVPVTVVRVDGQLDGQNYQNLIDKAKEVYESGARDFLLDLSGLTYISSAGLVALHSIALLTRGDPMPDTNAGWSALHSIGNAGKDSIQRHVKLLNPREEIKSVLDMVGFSAAFEIYTDFNAALQSF